jgi:hypothetical protein
MADGWVAGSEYDPETTNADKNAEPDAGDSSPGTKWLAPPRPAPAPKPAPQQTPPLQTAADGKIPYRARPRR